MELSNKKHIKTMDIDDKFHYLRTILLQVKEKQSLLNYNGNFLEEVILLSFVVDHQVTDSEYDLYFKLNKALGFVIKSKEEILKVCKDQSWIKKTAVGITGSIKKAPAVKTILMPFLETVFYMGRVITKDEQKFLDGLQ